MHNLCVKAAAAKFKSGVKPGQCPEGSVRYSHTIFPNPLACLVHPSRLKLSCDEHADNDHDRDADLDDAQFAHERLGCSSVMNGHHRITALPPRSIVQRLAL
jgi:hypothetical protein